MTVDHAVPERSCILVSRIARPQYHSAESGVETLRIPQIWLGPGGNTWLIGHCADPFLPE
jgi:hypothetical protein